MTGSVSVLTNAGIAPVIGGGPVSVGSRIITGPDGSAALSIGRACSLSLGPNSEADVALRSRQVCVSVSQSAPTLVAPEVSAINPAVLAGGVVALGGIGAAIGLAASGGRPGNGTLFPGIPVPQISP